MDQLVVMADSKLDWSEIIVAAIGAVALIATTILGAVLTRRFARGAKEVPATTIDTLFAPIEAAGEAATNPEVIEALLIGWATLKGGPVAGKKMADAVQEVHKARERG